jgi:hypothetical protein
VVIMRIIIAGSRDIDDYDALLRAVEASAFSISEVVCGVDTLGARWASERGVPCSMFAAQWDRFGKAAGMYRNSDMADYVDALWDGESRDMIDKMRGKPREVWVDGGLL